MKKLFTILAIAILAFSLSINASAYSVDDGYLDRAVTLLADLGIITDTGAYTDPVTRGDFTNMLVKALGIGDVATSNPIPFTDVARGDSYYDAVQTAYNLGIISRAELFNPSRIITYDEIVKMTVCAAGYTFLADHFGTYPAGHQAAANRLGMLKGITAADCTYATAYVLLYNTITTDLPEVTIVDGVPEYSIDSGTNILESAYGLSLIEGQVDGAEFFGGVSGSGVGEGYTTIDGVLLKKGEFDTDSMYGSACSAWYDATGTIRTIYAEAPGKNDVLVFKSGEDVTYSNKTYTYYTDDGDTQRSVTIDYDCLVVLNGKEAVYSDAIMLPEHGTVKLVRTGKGGYDTVIIDSYTEIVAGGIDSVKMVVADANNPAVSVSAKENDYTRVEIYDQNGRVVDFSAIEKNDILWVAKSQDSELLKILVSKNKFIGEYTGIQGDSFINVDGSDYPLAASASQLLDSSTVIGSLVMLHLNFDGEVAHISPQSDISTIKVAYLMASKFYDGLQPKITVKLYTSEGKIETYETSSFFLVNGLKFETNKADYARLPKDAVNTSYMKAGLVTYATNSMRQLTRINYDDVTAKTFGGTYTDLYKNAQIDMDHGETRDKYIRYLSSDMTVIGLGTGRIFVDSSTMQFRVPEPKDAAIAEESDYKIRKFSDIPSGEYLDNYNHKGYTIEVGSMRSNYMLSTYELANSTESVDIRGDLYIVTGVSRGFTPDGDETTVLTVSSKTTENFKLYVKDDTFIKTNGISEGAIIKASHRNGVTDGLHLLYKPGSDKLSNVTTYVNNPYTSLDSDTILTSNEGSATIAPSYVTLAKAYKRQDALTAFLPYCYDISGTVDESKLISYSILSLPKIIKFNTKSKTVSTVNYTNISDYLSMGSSCDTVVVEGSYGLIQALFVFE